MITREEINEVLTILMDGSSDPYKLEYTKAQNVNGIDFKMVEQVGGEGEGDYYHIVSRFTRGDDTIFIKHIGFYSSYNGVEFDGLHHYYIVKPVEVVKIEYQIVEK